jgi:RNA polymerase sigma factor (sigma-70 family)
MKKSPRRPGPGVLELVERAPDVAGPATPPADAAGAGVAVGRAASFEEFYRREFPRLLVLARALAGDQWAEDVAQDSMVVACGQWSRIALMDSPVGYVRRICANKAVSRTRRASAERRALRRVMARRVELEPLSMDSERFWAELRRLPRRQAEAAALFYALDLPIPVVAETLGCAEGTAKAHLARARARLSVRFSVPEEQ